MKKEPRSAVLVPSLNSILCWSESIKGLPLTQEEVETLASTAPSIVLPVSIVSILEQARSYSDIDPTVAWREWQSLLGEIQEQGLAVADAFASPSVQLEADLPVVRTAAISHRLAAVDLVDNQMLDLREFAHRFFTSIETWFTGAR